MCIYIYIYIYIYEVNSSPAMDIETAVPPPCLCRRKGTGSAPNEGVESSSAHGSQNDTTVVSMTKQQSRKKRNTTRGKTSCRSRTSGSGEQVLLLNRMAKARVQTSVAVYAQTPASSCTVREMASAPKGGRHSSICVSPQ